jgi:phosphoglycolate phosphatase-like HAD superfamily hydrolase
VPSQTDNGPLVLFDVDLTLVASGPAGREVFDAAIAAALGHPPGDHGVSMAGKTDPQIASEILAFAAVAEEHHGTHLPVVLRALEDGLAAAASRIAAEGRVLPGVPALLERLSAAPGVVRTVLTGNIKANALVKLAAFGLDRWLDLSIGAYGSDSPDRTELVPIARSRAEERHGRAFPPERIWVVGDTPLDLACARAGGARCLLVATGHYPLGELAASGADAVLPDLRDTARVVTLLTGG